MALDAAASRAVVATRGSKAPPTQVVIATMAPASTTAVMAPTPLVLIAELIVLLMPEVSDMKLSFHEVGGVNVRYITDNRTAPAVKLPPAAVSMIDVAA